MRKLMYGGRFSSEEDFEEEIPRLNFDGATRFTFLHYLFRVLIPDSVAKSYFDNVSEQIYSSESSDYDLGFYDNPFDALWNHWRFLSTNNKLNFYQKLYDLKEYISSNDNFPQYEEENEYISKAIRESKRVFHYYDSLLNLTVSEIPILTEQAHWIERNYTRVSDFHYLDEERAKLPTEEEISAVIEKNSITLDEFKASTNENKRNVSFKNLELLQSKGSPIKLLNEDYQKIFDFFSSIHGERLTASNLKEKFDRDPFVVKGNSYTLEIVRGTKAQDQHKYCIFVKR